MTLRIRARSSSAADQENQKRQDYDVKRHVDRDRQVARSVREVKREIGTEDSQCRHRAPRHERTGKNVVIKVRRLVRRRALLGRSPAPITPSELLQRALGHTVGDLVNLPARSSRHEGIAENRDIDKIPVPWLPRGFRTE